MKKKNIIIACLAGVSALSVITIATTSAWFLAGVSANISNIELRLAGEKELFISTSPEEDTFKQEVTYDELDVVDGFVPVTSMFSSEWLDVKADKPGFKANPSIGGEFPTVDDARGGYFSQELYLYSEDNVIATISAADSIFDGDPEKNMEAAKALKGKYPELTLEQVYQNLMDIKKTLRFSILIPDEDNYSYTIVDPYKEGVTYLGGVLDSNGDGYFDFYKKNGQTFETVYGEVANRDKLIYTEPGNTDLVETDHSKVIFTATHKANVRMLDFYGSIDNGAGFAIENSLSMQEAENNLQIPLRAYTPQKLWLSIYLEGWDIDTINSKMYASFIINLQFKILKEMF